MVGVTCMAWRSTPWKMTARKRLTAKKPPKRAMRTKNANESGDTPIMRAYIGSVHVSNATHCRMAMLAAPIESNDEPKSL